MPHRRSRARGRTRDRGRGGRAHHRNVPARPHPYRRAPDRGRPRRRGAGGRPVAHAGAHRICARPPQDRHAAAARRPHHRLGRGRDAARRRSAGAVLDADRAHRASPGRVRHHPHHRGDAPDHSRQCPPLADVFRPDRKPRPALLPLDRGQDRALRRTRRAPDFPRAGRARRSDGLSQRHLDVAAGRGSAGAGRDHSGARKGARHPARLRHRVRPRRSARAQADVGDEAHAGAVPGRADQRNDRLRGGSGTGPGRRSERGVASRRGRRRWGRRA